MVRARNDDQGGGFFIDEDDDMDELLIQAANQGSAAVDELGPVGVELDESGDIAEVEKMLQGEPAPADTSKAIDDFLDRNKIPDPSKQDEKDIDNILDSYFEPEEEPKVTDSESVIGASTLEETPKEPEDTWGSLAIDDNLTVIEPEPEIAPTPPKEASVAAVESYESAAEDPAPVVEKVTTPAPETRLTPPGPTTQKAAEISAAEQAEFARKVIAAVDVYRELDSASKDVVAQLLAMPDKEPSMDEHVIAVRAVYADNFHKATQSALVEAKSANPVDRVFFILELPKDVLKLLGDLVAAYTGAELPSGVSDLHYAKALVSAIDELNDEPVIYAKAMTKVLDAAQG